MVHQGKCLVLILVKQTQYLDYKDDNSYFFVNGQEISKFKADNENVNFPTQFYLGSISNEFSATGSREVSLNGLSI